MPRNRAAREVQKARRSELCVGNITKLAEQYGFVYTPPVVGGGIATIEYRGQTAAFAWTVKGTFPPGHRQLWNLLRSIPAFQEAYPKWYYHPHCKKRTSSNSMDPLKLEISDWAAKYNIPQLQKLLTTISAALEQRKQQEVALLTARLDQLKVELGLSNEALANLVTSALADRIER